MKFRKNVVHSAIVVNVNLEACCRTAEFAVCSLDIDFINSIQPEFNINLSVWNQYEVYQSRHADFSQFEQYDLKDDLQLDFPSIFTPKWHLATTSLSPLWAIFYQTAGGFAWGCNVFQHPDTVIPAIVVLPPVPRGTKGQDLF